MSQPVENVGDCPDDASLQNLIAEAGERAELQRLEAHVDDCTRCAARLEGLAGAPDFEREFAKAGGETGHESVELTQLIDRLQATDPTVSRDQGAGDGISLIERFPPGTELGGYRIEGLIARGGMGVVLKAFDPELERSVAIKLLDPQRARGDDAKDRFLREARAAAAIDHEKVLPIFTVGEASDLPYLVMPFVEGETLQDKVDREGALRPEEASRIVEAVCLGLDAAHAAGLVHRDVKPANILLGSDGRRVWIADFGLARAVEDPSITGAGMMAGTPQFMSPEQADGGEADERSDLFSLGAVLYFMLAGRPPFTGDSSMTILRQVADSSPDWSRERMARVPAWLLALTKRLLRKSPAERPASAAEVAGIIASNGVTARRNHGLVAAAAVLILALIGTLVWASRDRGKPTMSVDVAFVGDEGYPSLAAAIEAAAAGDTVEIRGEQTIDTVALPPIERPLMIRSSAGGVELSRADLGGPVLDVNAPLLLEGIVLSQSLLLVDRKNASPDDDVLPPLLRVGTEGDVVLSHCTLMRARPGKGVGRKDGESGRRPNCVEVHDGGSLLMRRCELVSGTSVGVAVLGGGRFEAENSLMGCETALLIADSRDAERESRETRIAWRQSSFVGVFMTLVTSEPPQGAIHLEFDASVLLNAGPQIWTRAPLAAINPHVEARRNLYASQRGYVAVGIGRGGISELSTPRRTPIASFADWQSFVGDADKSSIELELSYVKRLVSEYNVTNFHASPKRALELLKGGLTDLLVDHADVGCDLVVVGAGDGFERTTADGGDAEWRAETVARLFGSEG